MKKINDAPTRMIIFEKSVLNNGGMDFSELWVIDSQQIEGTSTLVTGDSGR